MYSHKSNRTPGGPQSNPFEKIGSDTFVIFFIFFIKFLASSQPGIEFWILVNIYEIICLTFELEFQYLEHSERELKKHFFLQIHIKWNLPIL